MGRIMALDVGNARVGVALSDELKIIASPHSVIKRDEKTIVALLNIISSEKVELIVCGLPLSLDGRETEQAAKTREFCAMLSEKTDIKIVMFDERMSTASAERMLIDGNVRREKRKEVVDKIAATIILEGYMRKYQ